MLLLFEVCTASVSQKQELGTAKTNEYYLFESVIDRHQCHLVAC